LVDREVFGRRLAHLEILLRHLRQLATVERARFLAEAGLQAQAERWLQVAAECALDLANHVISDRGWRTPTSNREAFRILCEQGVLEQKLTTVMEGWAGLRNILAHLYLEIDHARLYHTLTTELDSLERYAASVARLAGG
jgi:uncharacterized protein YutE (UPF0331/DUF86 family)